MHVGPPARGSDLGAVGMAADAEEPRVYEAWKGSNVSADLCPGTSLTALSSLIGRNASDLLFGEISLWEIRVWSCDLFAGGHEKLKFQFFGCLYCICFNFFSFFLLVIQL
ncbi:hypothetical protein BHE74_00009885 [Ensete ventricosum]|nr:hypothetical protein GW17_00008274 [Ensete ventricosum]RWW81681.1 hypothetical protein BHE74_00009885 [Ensete ventricosum]RZR94261.1 hypothetical protein BHM03_00022922 [Ensete ventricosum]